MRLAYVLTIMLLCFGCSVAFYARTQANSTQQSPSLQLTTSIINQRYCVGDAELDFLQMDLRLCYTNVGQQQLILHKSSNQVFRVMVSRNMEEAAAGRFEANGSITRFTAGKSPKIEASVPGGMFIILPPGASYETQTDAFVTIARDNASQLAGVVSAGEHFLQIEVPTWPESNELGKKLRRRWQRSGFLWYDPVISMPMPFRVENQRKVVKCP